LIDWWQGEGNATDTVGGHNGILMNGVSFVPGEVGQAFSFDGVNDSVLINSKFPFYNSGDASLTFWLKFTPTSHQAVFWGRGDSADTNFFQVFVNGNGTLGFNYRSPSGVVHDLVGELNLGIDIPADTWTHVAITRAGNVYSIYRDGTFITKATDASPDLPTATQWQFSGRSGFIYRGGLDEVQLYDRALSATEVQELFRSASLSITSALGDFNGDGKVDLAATNPGDDSVHLQLGNGNGTFAAATLTPAGTSPAAILAADLNGDGHLDIATANAAGNDISLLLGNGDGTFATAAHYGVGTSPGALAFGDLDGDGHPDLVVANTGGHDISVLLNHGDGTFATEVRYAARDQPNSVALGDFNGDGKIDVAVANLHSVSVLLNHGDGTLDPQVVYGANSPHALKTADFNGDGHLDLIVANRSQVTVLIGHGDGTFRSQVHSGQGFHPQDLVVGDFNGDGNLDLATANQHSVSVLLGFGDYSFQNPVFYSRPRPPQALAAADLDGDGDLDLVVLDPAGVSVLLNDGHGNFSPV
jgi:hypothetical protein